MVDWLLAPIDVTRPHEIGVLVAWHGRLMVLAWSFLFPVAVLTARYAKVTPRQDWPRERDSTTWWHTHLALQYCGGLAVAAALWLIWQVAAGEPLNKQHELLGWTAVVLCAVQFVSGWLRGSKGGPTAPAADGTLAGDHFDMTARRIAFEYIHKTIGYLALVVAAAATMTGLWTANAPHWMWIALSIWWIVFIVVFAALQRRGLAIDTYQAIWGPAPDLPGNRRKAIGWGIRRSTGDDRRPGRAT